MINTLPPLPEPARQVVYNESKGYTFGAYTADQMHKYAEAAVVAERERCITVAMYELDSNGQAQAIEAEIRGVDWQNAKRKEAEDRLAKLRIQGTAAGNMLARLDAERYRFLRNSSAGCIAQICFDKNLSWRPVGETLDAAIDAAMKDAT